LEASELACGRQGFSARKTTSNKLCTVLPVGFFFRH
jgi:hypothetical protein